MTNENLLASSPFVRNLRLRIGVKTSPGEYFSTVKRAEFFFSIHQYLGFKQAGPSVVPNLLCFGCIAVLAVGVCGTCVGVMVLVVLVVCSGVGSGSNGEELTGYERPRKFLCYKNQVKTTNKFLAGTPKM
jgi:hypothetical protein